jgi:uncharacterized protein YjbI with pentapeptide repeats
MAMGAKFGDADLSGSKANSKTSFAGAFLARADMSQVKWDKTVLDGATMDRVILENADLTGCSLIKAQMINAIAKQACFDKVNLEQADLRGVNFFEGSMRKAKLKGALLEVGNYYGVDFIDAAIDGASFRDSILDKTILALRNI